MMVNKANNQTLLNSLNTRKTMTYDVGNPGPGFGQAHRCGEVKQVNRIPTCCS